MERTSGKKDPLNTANPASPLKEWWNFIQQHKALALIFIAFHIIFAFILRYYYPYTDISSDSGSYIRTSFKNIEFAYGGPRPLGYSNILGILHSTSTAPVFIVQYMVYCISLFCFYFTLIYFIRSRHLLFNYLLLACLIIFIPGLYMTNMLMSDSIFSSLTILIITLLIWVQHTGKAAFIIPMILITVFAVTIRYIGFIYPALIIPVLYIAVRNKLHATLYSVLLVGSILLYVEHIRTATEEETGVRIFSGFAGWQKANNALHIVPHIDTSMPIVKTTDHEMLYFDTLTYLCYRFYGHVFPDSNEVTYDFIWNEESPLKIGMNYYGDKIKEYDYYTTWNKVSSRFNDYADLLIKQNFREYVRYYIYNNAKRTLHPPLEVLSAFADSATIKGVVVTDWFDWKDNEQIYPRKDFLRPALLKMPTVYTFYWCALFISIMMYLAFLILKPGIFKKPTFSITTLLIVFILIYTAASIYAAPVNLRFLLPLRPLMVALPFILAHVYSNVNIAGKSG